LQIIRATSALKSKGFAFFISTIPLILAKKIFVLATPLPHVDDAQLILWLHQRNRQAMEVIYERYAARMYGVIKCVVKEDVHAAEILTACLDYVWKKTAQYDTIQGELVDWLLHKARLRAIHYLRTKRLRDGSHVQVEQRPWDQLLTSEAALAEHDVMDGLDAETQQLFSLLYFSAFSEEEAIDHLGIDAPSLRARAKAAFVQLAQSLK
jgi:RNA polymerase sigma-70 factor (ECF subfamily)